MADLAQTANQTIRIPANVMGLLRQSYDSREKVMDWLLAISVAGALVYAFRDQLLGFVNPPDAEDPNAGRAESVYPDMDLATAFPHAGTEGGRWPALYQYNMPAARNIRYSVGPSSGTPPVNPSSPNSYPG